MLNSSSLRVVCGLIFNGGRVLATRRDPSRGFPLYWEFPGGKLEDGESSEEAIHRELEEELSLKVSITAALEPVHYHDADHNICLIPFTCHPDQTHGPIPRDHVEIRWITPNEGQQLTWAPADIPLVEQLNDLIKTL